MLQDIYCLETIFKRSIVLDFLYDNIIKSYYSKHIAQLLLVNTGCMLCEYYTHVHCSAVRPPITVIIMIVI